MSGFSTAVFHLPPPALVFLLLSYLGTKMSTDNKIGQWLVSLEFVLTFEEQLHRDLHWKYIQFKKVILIE